MEGSRHDERFEVVGSAESAAPEARFEGTNVCRVAALSTLLAGDRRLVRTVNAPLTELGIPQTLSSGERLWSEDAPGSFEGLQDREFQADGPGSQRAALWRSLQEASDSGDGVAFLVAVLGSPLERESAAAASALFRHVMSQTGPATRSGRLTERRLERIWYRLAFRGPLLADGWGFPMSQPFPYEPDAEFDEPRQLDWRPEQWLKIYAMATALFGDRYDNLAVIALLVRLRLSQALRSSDSVTRTLAQAAFWPQGEPNSDKADSPSSPTPTQRRATQVSTMIHGTKAWAGNWWEPGGGFHQYIRDGYRSNLCTRGAVFSWSGAYRSRHRQLAGERFARWASDLAAGGLQTVFGHSYGGEVAARAVASHHIQVDELIFLSTPVTSYIDEAVATGIRVVDVRLGFDPVLALARTRQRIDSQANVTQVLLNRWRLDHGASHDRDVWDAEAVAERGQITPC
jgi:hypothetical protein